jgi:amino acid transporter
VAITVLAGCWALCLGLGFERLVTIDVLLYGMSLALEFVALIVLRVREPGLNRPFKVPGGMASAILIGVFPVLLLGFSIVHGEGEKILGMSGLVFGMLLIGAGFVVYWATSSLRHENWKPAALKSEREAA